jgi:hypothetical protein
MPPVEESLKGLTKELLALVKKHGTRSKPVRDFLKAHRSDPDFDENYVLTLLLLREGVEQLHEEPDVEPAPQARQPIARRASQPRVEREPTR